MKKITFLLIAILFVCATISVNAQATTLGASEYDHIPCQNKYDSCYDQQQEPGSGSCTCDDEEFDYEDDLDAYESWTDEENGYDCLCYCNEFDYEDDLYGHDDWPDEEDGYDCPCYDDEFDYEDDLYAYGDWTYDEDSCYCPCYEDEFDYEDDLYADDDWSDEENGYDCPCNEDSAELFSGEHSCFDHSGESETPVSLNENSGDFNPCCDCCTIK